MTRRVLRRDWAEGGHRPGRSLAKIAKPAKKMPSLCLREKQYLSGSRWVFNVIFSRSHRVTEKSKPKDVFAILVREKHFSLVAFCRNGRVARCGVCHGTAAPDNFSRGGAESAEKKPQRHRLRNDKTIETGELWFLRNQALPGTGQTHAGLIACCTFWTGTTACPTLFSANSAPPREICFGLGYVQYPL